MTIRILRHRSEALQGNPCDDPAERDLWVYLPPGYDESTDEYPVLWCLTGFTGTGEKAVTGDHWSPGLGTRLDRLIGAGCPPVIVAFPDCFTRWGGSQYVNSPATGRYEDYVCDELVPLVEREFRVRSGARGVFGKSSGGYGALRLAMRRPGLFRAVASHSGDMAFALCYTGFPAAVGRIAAAGSLERWVERFEAQEKKSGADFDAINMIAMAAAYSPDASEPFGIALPVDLRDGELRPQVWAEWRRNDPLLMIEDAACQAALRGLDMLFLDCGSRDQYQLHLGMRVFVEKLQEFGIGHEAQEFDDDHRGLSYRYAVSIPMLAAALLDRE
ncbi:MAG: alpha/beta hydrolase [Planctomycetota bacterium]